jgi:5-oxoprolinase (ATP-hydrolysing) subunit C
MMEDHAPAVFRVLRAGPRTSLQDAGRAGLKCWGIPASGAMDLGVVEDLNRLFDQDPHTAAYEMLWAGVELLCLRDSWIAFGGAARGFLQNERVAAGRTIRVKSGQTLRLEADAGGLWSYLTIAGAWRGERWFGSQSVWPEGGMRSCLRMHDLLYRQSDRAWECPPGVNARFVSQAPTAGHDAIRVWKGPQWDAFATDAIEKFFLTEWRISEQSSRAGYRLQGSGIHAPSTQLISEPTLLGSIQVPGNGQPIVLLNDGPTIGGYHKIALIHPDDLDRFRQTPPGRNVRFTLI